MSKKKIISVTVICITILIIFSLIKIINIIDKIKEKSFQNNTIDLSSNIVNENVDTQKLEEIKNEIGITGSTELYEIQKGTDNVEVAVVKPSVKYKVAFAGMIKGQVPNINELDDILETEHPKENGIWIEKNSRKKFIEMIKKVAKSEYEIDNNGYLKIVEKNQQNENDKILENSINSNKKTLIDISSVCYIVDDISGEILDYNFEKLDIYQTYEYFKDNDNCLIFITENTRNVLSETEIIESVLQLQKTNEK